MLGLECSSRCASLCICNTSISARRVCSRFPAVKCRVAAHPKAPVASTQQLIPDDFLSIPESLIYTATTGLSLPPSESIESASSSPDAALQDELLEPVTYNPYDFSGRKCGWIEEAKHPSEQQLKRPLWTGRRGQHRLVQLHRTSPTSSPPAPEEAPESHTQQRSKHHSTSPQPNDQQLELQQQFSRPRHRHHNHRQHQQSHHHSPRRHSNGTRTLPSAPQAGQSSAEEQDRHQHHHHQQHPPDGTPPQQPYQPIYRRYLRKYCRPFHKPGQRFRRTANLGTTTTTEPHPSLTTEAPTTPTISLFIPASSQRYTLQHWDAATAQWHSQQLQQVHNRHGHFLHASLPLPSSPPPSSPAAQQEQQPPPCVRLKLLCYPSSSSQQQPGEQCYTVPEPGTYLLQAGKLRRVLHQPVMLIMDLDSLASCSSTRSRLAPQHQHQQQPSSSSSSTAQSRAAAQAFASVWAASAQLHPSYLVVSTQLQWSAFQRLWRDHQQLLPAPDAVIAGAGTRIYYCTPSHIEEDLGFRALLDDGWDLAAATAATAELARRYGRGAVRLAHDRHQSCHRLRVKVKRAVFDRVVEEFDRRMGAAGVRYSSCSSGKGSWVWWDVLPAAGGVGRAVQHVRERLQWQLPLVLAAGSAAAVQQLQDGCDDADAVMLVSSSSSLSPGGGVLDAPNLLDGLEMAGFV